jgi:hypothetical protein
MSKNEITTVAEFVARVAEIKKEQVARGNKSDLFFRGQPCDKPLLPKLGRIVPKGKLPNIEKLLLKSFDDASCRAALKTENVGNGVGLLHLNRIFRTFGAGSPVRRPASN